MKKSARRQKLTVSSLKDPWPFRCGFCKWECLLYHFVCNKVTQLPHKGTFRGLLEANLEAAFGRPWVSCRSEPGLSMPPNHCPSTMPWICLTCPSTILSTGQCRRCPPVWRRKKRRYEVRFQKGRLLAAIFKMADPQILMSCVFFWLCVGPVEF